MRTLIITAAVIFACGLSGCSSSQISSTPGMSGPDSRRPLACPAPTRNAAQMMYVANETGDSITAYPTTARGDVAPTTDIAGPLTQLGFANWVDVDAAGEVVALSDNAILFFAPGATGNVAPVHKISGSATLMDNAVALGIDHRDRIFVDTFRPGPVYKSAILEFSSQTYGNAAPIAVIQGGRTGLTGPAGMAFDRNDNIYVANGVDSAILAFRRSAHGDVAPFIDISGSDAFITLSGGIAVDQAGDVFVDGQHSHSEITPSLMEFAPGANGNVAPISEIYGPDTKLKNPAGLAMDPCSDRIYTVGHNSIRIYAAGSNGDVKPVQGLSGPNTLLNHPLAITVK